jgi:hypothetical protein
MRGMRLQDPHAYILWAWRSQKVSMLHGAKGEDGGVAMSHDEDMYEGRELASGIGALAQLR